jgi:cell division protein FtsQ
VTDDLPVRGARVRRRGGRRRASAGFSPRRALAALVLLAMAGATWGVVASPVFGVKTVLVEGATLTGDEAVLAALGLVSPPPNAFTIPTDQLGERLLGLPAVADAEVSVGLPGTLRVRVTERAPVLAWSHAGSLYLVDRDGRVVADATAEVVADATAGLGAIAAAAAGLPLVTDLRTDATPLAVGGQLDPLDLDVATRLLPLVPSDVGSSAPALVVAVDDRDGWTITPDATDPWTAVFGFYGPEIRRPDMVPEQVRSLGSLLAGREKKILRVVLAGETKGTFILKAEP